MKHIEYISGTTFHDRKGGVKNRFSYSIDYILIECETKNEMPLLFSQNSRNFMSLYDSDHGGNPGNGRGVDWVYKNLKLHKLQENVAKVYLLAQPRVFGYVFNPVSFWLCYDLKGKLKVVIAEVSNTFGDRHSYICAHEDAQEIKGEDLLHAKKVFHVSPFQSVKGQYKFRFNITEKNIDILIDYSAADNGVLATLTGKRQTLTNWSILKLLLRRPLGSVRVIGLIHFQAIKLWFKGAEYRRRPKPPNREVSR